MTDLNALMTAPHQARGALPDAPLSMPTQVLEPQGAKLWDRLAAVLRPSRQPHGV